MATQVFVVLMCDVFRALISSLVGCFRCCCSYSCLLLACLFDSTLPCEVPWLPAWILAQCVCVSVSARAFVLYALNFEKTCIKKMCKICKRLGPVRDRHSKCPLLLFERKGWGESGVGGGGREQ